MQYSSYNNSVEISLKVQGSIPTCYMPSCKYGSAGYRKNPCHFREFRHPVPLSNQTRINFIISKEESYENFLRRVQSLYDCRNVNFTLQASNFMGTFLINSTHSLRTCLHNAQGCNPYVTIIVTFSPQQFVISCSKCCEIVSGSQCYYRCIQCSIPFYLCSSCELQESNLPTHTRSHFLAKVYPHQQSLNFNTCLERQKPVKQQQRENDAKLDEVIDKLESLSFKVDDLSEHVKVPEVMPVLKTEPAVVEAKIEIEQDLSGSILALDSEQNEIARRLACMEQICALGFTDKTRVWHLVMASSDLDLNEIVANLIETN